MGRREAMVGRRPGVPTREAKIDTNRFPSFSMVPLWRGPGLELRIIRT